MCEKNLHVILIQVIIYLHLCILYFNFHIALLSNTNNITHVFRTLFLFNLHPHVWLWKTLYTVLFISKHVLSEELWKLLSPHVKNLTPKTRPLTIKTGDIQIPMSSIIFKTGTGAIPVSCNMILSRIISIYKCPAVF